jgi:mannose-6-phosphate isomerase-like protein (cupin superfamily)
MANSPMQPHDLRAAWKAVPQLLVSPTTTPEDALASMRELGSLNECTLGVIRFSGETPWERHPGGDELLHVLEGEVDLTVLTDSGPVDATIGQGSIFVVPRGLWHRQRPRPSVTLLFATPVEGGEHSWAEDPRVR